MQTFGKKKLSKEEKRFIWTVFVFAPIATLVLFLLGTCYAFGIFSQGQAIKDCLKENPTFTQAECDALTEW